MCGYSEPETKKVERSRVEQTHYFFAASFFLRKLQKTIRKIS
jgi:hypothetical protein